MAFSQWLTYQITFLPIAAKQEAFEQSIRLKNQFRNLDEDEIEFLDAVLESTRAKEEAVKKETGEQLDIFRKAQEEADRKALLRRQDGDDEGNNGNKAGSPVEGEETTWVVVGKKRKRGKEKEGIKGMKMRRGSEMNDGDEKTATIGEKKALDGSPEKVVSRVVNDGRKRTTSTTKSSHPTVVTPSFSTTGKVSPTAASPVPTTKSPGLGLAGYSSDEDN